MSIDLADYQMKARESAKAKGLEGKVTFLESDVLNVDLSEATLVLCYLVPKASSDLKPKFEAELKPGARIVMEHFPVREWTPERTVERGNKQFYLYTMPHQQCMPQRCRASARMGHSEALENKEIRADRGFLGGVEYTPMKGARRVPGNCRENPSGRGEE